MLGWPEAVARSGSKCPPTGAQQDKLADFQPLFDEKSVMVVGAVHPTGSDD
jgi:hypothetical protein